MFVTLLYSYGILTVYMFPSWVWDHWAAYDLARLIPRFFLHWDSFHSHNFFKKMFAAHTFLSPSTCSCWSFCTVEPQRSLHVLPLKSFVFIMLFSPWRINCHLRASSFAFLILGGFSVLEHPAPKLWSLLLSPTHSKVAGQPVLWNIFPITYLSSCSTSLILCFGWLFQFLVKKSQPLYFVFHLVSGGPVLW